MLDFSRYLILGGMILFPTAFVEIRGAFILMAIALSFALKSKNLYFNREIILITLVLVILNILALFNGLIHGNEVTSSIQFYIIWPVIFLVFSAYPIKYDNFSKIASFIAIISIVGVLLILLGIITTLFVGKTIFFREVYLVELGFVNGNPKIGSPYLPILCCSIPFLMFHSLLNASTNRLAIVSLCLLLFAVISGRSVFILLTGLIITLLIINYVFLNDRSKSIIRILFFMIGKIHSEN